VTVNTKHNKTNVNYSTYRCVTSVADRITAFAHNYKLVLAITYLA